MLAAESHRGVALIVALTLLLLMTVFALVAATRSTTELLMAANEQYRRRASQAASAAVEDAIAHIGEASPNGAARAVRGPLRLADGGLENFSSTTSFAGTGAPLLAGSVDRFVAYHYAITGVGTSARAARDVQTQGIAVISPINAVADFHRTEGGLP